MAFAFPGLQRRLVWSLGWFLAILVLMPLPESLAQCCGGGGGRGRRQSVGGVYIDAQGHLCNAELDQSDQLRQALLRGMQEQPGDVAQPSELRKVSLRRLEQALEKLAAEGKRLPDDLPDEMRYLAGLQNIHYVLVYPETNDIVLAGFGEGWTVDKQGFIVGRTTGRPTLLLDDLIVALRTARRSESTGISCSIDPTPDGLTNLRHFASSLRALTGDTAEQIERVLGPQVISITGVPASSHFALVLVAADYRMKRIGMHLDTSPVDGLKSYLEMITVAGRGVQSLTPRWWLVPRYAPLLTNAAGTAWELRGGSVEAMTEDTLFSNDGSKAQTGKSSPAAAQWAKSFTARYDELSAKDPIFARLRNCMDFAVVAALMAKEHLAEKAGCSFSLLTDPTQLPANEYEAPRTTASKVSVVRRPSGYVVSASGGVEIRPYEVIEKTEQSAALDPVRGSAAPAANARWWWN